MQKFLLRIFLVLIAVVLGFFLYSAYQYYRVLHADDPVVPYLSADVGSSRIIRGDRAIVLSEKERYNLQEKDIIITDKDALAVVTWPDRSQTRVGNTSRMQIERMQVARDYTSIEIEFALEQWRVWSTVVRTIYPGSYFRTKIPGQWVVAWVRGTVYDIDLTRGYIRSIDHNVTLTDRRGNIANPSPGELVSVTDILKKLTREVVDASWTTLNQAKDLVFLEARKQSLQEQFDKISGKTANLWDRFVRWILSFLPSFEDIAVIQSLLSDIPWFEDIDIPKEQLLRVYQKVQDTKFVQEREKIRQYIQGKSGALSLEADYIETFTRWAIWDQMSFSGMTLDSAETLVTDYAKSLDGQIQNVMQVVPTRELDTKARETLRQLLK